MVNCVLEIGHAEHSTTDATALFQEFNLARLLVLLTGLRSLESRISRDLPLPPKFAGLEKTKLV